MSKSEKPLYSGGYSSDYIENEIIPKIFEIINDSGLSFTDSLCVPPILNRKIRDAIVAHEKNTRFTATLKQKEEL